MQAKLIRITPDAESTIAYCARVSSNNQDNPAIAGLLNYCIKHNHWSVFEQASMTIEIETSRAISMQVLRHRSAKFQQFSQRYNDFIEFEPITPRRQAESNRQSSIDDLDPVIVEWFNSVTDEIDALATKRYFEALEKGVARESARFWLPEHTKTRFYMTGDIRTWIHYLQVRLGDDTQLEHREIAIACKEIFEKEMPIIATAVWGVG